MTNKFFKILPFGIIIAVPFLMATTYVIKEGGQEVGRYDEADGKAEVVEIGADKPKPVPMKKETKLEYSSDGGYNAQWVETGRTVPDKKRKMLVNGRVLNILTLKPVPGGKLIFSVDLEKHEVPVAWSGNFSASIPRPEKMAMTLSYVPPKGYRKDVGILHTGQLEKISEKDRRQMAEGIAFSGLTQSSWVDLELSAVPEKLPPAKADEQPGKS